MTPPPASSGALGLPLPPPPFLFPVSRQDSPVPTPDGALPDGPSRQTLLLSGGAFAFIPFTFLLLFYVCMRREFKRSLLRRHEGILRSGAHNGVAGANGGGGGGGGGGHDSRGRAVPPPSGVGGGGGGCKRMRFSDGDAVASALDVTPLADGATTQCAICLDESHPDRTEAALACGHTYHGACIRQWLAKSDTCPLCATPVRAALFAAAEERGWKGAGKGADVTVPMDDDEEEGEAMATATTRPAGGNGPTAPGAADVAAALPAMAPDTVVVIRPSGFDHPPVAPPAVAAGVPSG